MTLKTAVLLAAFAASFSAPAIAQELMQSWSVSELKGIVDSAGAKVTKESKSSDGDPTVAVETKEGLKFDIYGAECEKIGGVDRCRGLEMAAVFNLKQQKDVDDALSWIDYAAVGYNDAGDGDLKVTRYVIFDHGLPRGNVQVNLEVFINICHEIWDGLDDKGYFDN